MITITTEVEGAVDIFRVVLRSVLVVAQVG